MNDKEKELASIKKEIFDLLEQLNEQQQKEFVWRCCVRALPFLSDNVILKFWDEVYIDPIFNVLDLMSYGGKYTEEVIIEKISENFEGTEEEKAQQIAEKIAEVFKEAAEIEDSLEQLQSLNDDAYMEIPEDMEDEYHQDDDYFDSDDYYDLHGSIISALHVVEALSISAQFFKQSKKKVSLQKIVDRHFSVIAGYLNTVTFAQTFLNDLRATTTNQKPTFSVNLYQKPIEKFEQAMPKLYYGKETQRYKSIWNNDFKMNIGELKERIASIV